MLAVAAGCSSGYRLPDGAYGGNGGANSGMGGSNNPQNDGGSDAGATDDGGFDAGWVPDSGCSPVTSPTGCYPIGSPCFPSLYANGGCSSSLLCHTYVNDAGSTQSTCCQLSTTGTYLCQ